jgi:hypothetical protein
MSWPIDIEADNVSELVGELRVFRQLESTDAVRGELMGSRECPPPNAGLHPPPWPTSARSNVWSHRAAAKAPDRQRATVSIGKGALPGLRVLSRSSPSTPSCMKRSCQRQTTGLERPRAAHNLDGAAAIGRGESDVGTPHMFLRAAAVRNDCLKPIAIFRRDVDGDPCSHVGSLNCFGQFGNRPNESDH